MQNHTEKERKKKRERDKGQAYLISRWKEEPEAKASTNNLSLMTRHFTSNLFLSELA